MPGPKLRGKNNEETRGKYTRQAFRYESEDRNEIFELGIALHRILANRGVSVGVYEQNDTSYTIGSFSYHIAGATVGMDVAQRKDQLQSYVQLKIISNDSLSDIEKLINNNFPIFNELGKGDVI